MRLCGVRGVGHHAVQQLSSSWGALAVVTGLRSVRPPPVKWGARMEPWRARPVPFWRNGLRPPPETHHESWCCRCLDAGSKLSINNLVHQRNAGLTVEDVSRQLNLAVGATIQRCVRRASDWSCSFTALHCGFHGYRPPRAPGIAPLMISRLASVSIFESSRFWWRDRYPCVPAMRVPLETRPGVAQAPMPPTRRCAA